MKRHVQLTQLRLGIAHAPGLPRGFVSYRKRHRATKGTSSVAVCPYCGSPKHEDDKWGYCWQPPLAECVKGFWILYCIVCGGLIMEKLGDTTITLKWPHFWNPNRDYSGLPKMARNFLKSKKGPRIVAATTSIRR